MCFGYCQEVEAASSSGRRAIAGVRESVTVSAETKAIETEPRGTSAVIDERAIANPRSMAPLY